MSHTHIMVLATVLKAHNIKQSRTTSIGVYQHSLAFYSRDPPGVGVSRSRSLIRGPCLRIIITATPPPHQSAGGLGRGGTQPGQSLPLLSAKMGALARERENSAIVLICSLMETFKCHWCLEPNVIL